MAFTYLKVKSTRCLCLLSGGLGLGHGLKNLVLFTSLVDDADDKLFEHILSNHSSKVEGDQGVGPKTGALASRARPEAGLGWVRQGSPPPAVGFRGCYPRKFLKTQMLNPAFWWFLRSLWAPEDAYIRANNKHGKG